MSDANPFQYLFAFTAILLLAAGVFGIVAPSIGIETPDPPEFPTVTDFTVVGNWSSEYAFDESFSVSTNEVQFTSFSPDKRIIYNVDWLDSSVQFFKIQRNALAAGFWWYDEPISYADGTLINSDKSGQWWQPLNSFTLTPQLIANNFDGDESLFVVDPNNNLYECWASFTPLEGYSDMTSSWNNGHGFNLRLYGNAYEEADWLAQLTSYLAWFGNLLAYIVYFLAYMIQVAAVLFTVFGLVPEVAAGVVALVVCVFIGSLLMFIRGSGNGSEAK